MEEGVHRFIVLDYGYCTVLQRKSARIGTFSIEEYVLICSPYFLFSLILNACN
jgi:hypothetical protein